MYISSADFMTRNTVKRVEVAAPIYDKDIQNEILDIFRTMLSDNVKARVQYGNGTYRRKTVRGKKLNSQQAFIEKATENAMLITEQASKEKDVQTDENYTHSDFYRAMLMQ